MVTRNNEQGGPPVIGRPRVGRVPPLRRQQTERARSPPPTPLSITGGCLCLAELARRGLLLPASLPRVVPVVLQALATGPSASSKALRILPVFLPLCFSPLLTFLQVVWLTLISWLTEPCCMWSHIPTTIPSEITGFFFGSFSGSLPLDRGLPRDLDLLFATHQPLCGGPCARCR